MATFSWSDTAQAVFGSCLPYLRCFPTSHNNDTDVGDLSRRDELESLLQGAEFSDAEMDADALSLHSQLGRQNGRKRIQRKRGRNRRTITLFGFDLFGRPLPDPEASGGGSDHEHDIDSRRISRMSSSTLDSDAAPLADDAIAELSTQTQARQEAEEARKARKQRHKQKKAAASLAAHADAFEGCPGSGPLPEDFGAFQQAPADQSFIHGHSGSAEEVYGDEEEEADFGASSYIRKAAPRSDSGSGSRSRTSASMSNTQELATVPAHHVPLPPSSAGSSAAPASKAKRSKKSGKRSATTTSSNSQPRSPTTEAYVPHVDIASPTREGFVLGNTFEGIPNDGGAFGLEGEDIPDTGLSSPRDLPSPGFARDLPSPGLGKSRGFPSPGLGGRKNSLSVSGNGAFLARTGHDA
ncbi:hypothetical protein K439DRAFT_687219 [Ramaria rubella]|nr:hypothetical protein K439DRAFT_687219 [Ramaria rubella]